MQNPLMESNAFEGFEEEDPFENTDQFWKNSQGGKPIPLNAPPNLPLYSGVVPN